jgi:hypothetical protein
MAVRAPDPHNLRAAAEHSAAAMAPIIDTDRACLGCGYNLRGLRAGVKCPECGLPSKLPANLDDPLSLMPRSVIFAFTLGCWAATVCVILTVAMVLSLRFEAWESWITLCGLTAIAVLWLGATMLITPGFAIPQAVVRGFSQGGRLRRAARWLQLGWPMFAGATLLREVLVSPAGSATAALQLLQFVGFAAGMAGIVTLSLLLQRLADWTRDGEANTAFNWTMWGLPVVTPLMLLDSPLLSANLILKFLIPLLWLGLVCTFPFGLLTLSKSVTLSIAHSFEHEARLERKAERDRKHQEKMAKLLKR